MYEEGYVNRESYATNKELTKIVTPGVLVKSTLYDYSMIKEAFIFRV